MVDADLHNEVPDLRVLLPYLPPHWKEFLSQSRITGPVDTSYPAGARTSCHPSLAKESAQTLGDLQINALAPWQTEIGILNCSYAVESLHNPDLATAFAAAVNHWQVEHWLEPEPRLRASIVVPSHYPSLAAAEIDRWKDEARFVQVFLPARSPMPYGSRHYWPVFEKAVAHNLTVGIHFGGNPGNPSTPSGWPSYFIEEYTGMASVFQSQLISLIAEGVFAQFPDLRIVMIEGGWTWLPGLMWRLDKEWKGLRREIPWVRELPSELIRKHVRFTLQPLDAPPNPRALLEVIDQFQGEDLLLFSSDYPHWHFDRPEEALPSGLSDLAREKIMDANARSFYRF